MRLASTLRRNRHAEPLPGVIGTARLDRHTKRLTARLQPGDVAVIEHVDLDSASADALVAAGVAAVVNASASISGRYPNLGPEILLDAGIPLLDDVGPEVFGMLRDGETVRLHDGGVYRGEQFLVAGQEQDVASVAQALTQARTGLTTQLEAFAANTVEHLLEDRDLLLDGAGVPDITTALEGRPAVIVVRGHDYRDDLTALRPYIRDQRPVLIGVDGGADALLEAGLRPDLIVGDLDAVSDDALGSGAEVVVRADPDGRARGLERVQDLGVPAVLFPAAGTSQDVAMLLADSKGATLLVAVGSHTTLVEFLDQGRPAMASSFLTRLRVGGTLVDAKAVSRLHRRQISVWPLLLLVLSTLLVMAAAAYVSSAGSADGALVTQWWHDLRSWLDGLF
jgi:uncharacterized membrane-anchored protein